MKAILYQSVCTQCAYGVMRHKHGLPDSQWIVVTMDNGTAFTIGASWALPPGYPHFPTATIEFVTTEGALLIDDSHRDIILSTMKKGMVLPRDRALDAGQRALTLAEALGDGERLMDAAAAVVSARYVAGHAAGAAALGERALVLPDAHGHEVGQVRVRVYLAEAYITLGDYRRAIALLERNREVLADATACLWVSNTGVHAGVASDYALASALARVGEFGRATAVAEEGARLSMASDTAVNRLFVLLGLSIPAVTICRRIPARS